MLKDRILSTLRFFDLQDTPLTLLELHKFLLADMVDIKKHLNQQWEIQEPLEDKPSSPVSAGEILRCLETEIPGEVECKNGFYALRGRGEPISQRLENYLYGIQREKLVRKYLYGVRHVPFVRGVGLLGSQVLGQQKKDSDIDLLILVKPGFMWLARLLVTAYFQFTGHRRHGKKVANRFCLNHYIVAGKGLKFDRNLYTAAEYLKIRPLVLGWQIRGFQEKNRKWIRAMFPQVDLSPSVVKEASFLQTALENLIDNGFGKWLERQSKKPQHKRLNVGEFIVASDDELSFHPNNRKMELFRKFFNYVPITSRADDTNLIRDNQTINA